MHPRAKNAGRRLLRAALRPAPLREALRRLSQRDLLPDQLWMRLPVEAAFELRYPGGIAFRYQASAEDAIARHLYWKGAQRWNWETLEVLCNLAPRARRVLDIGANTGLCSLIACASHPKTQVRAFEPVPRVRALLEANLALNGFAPRCAVHAEAVSDVVGTARFHVPDEGLPTSSSLDPAGFQGLPGALIDVSLVTVDALLPPDEAVDLVKIDVEGFEDRVLRGMERVLRGWRPAVVFECNPGGPAAAIEAVFAAQGYRLHHLLPGGPRRVDALPRDPANPHHDFLALPPEKLGWANA